MTDPLIARLGEPRRLDAREARATFATLVASGTTDDRRVEVLRALAGRPTDAGELTLFVLEMQRRARPFNVPPGDRPIDLCGSGGARTPSFNVSTVSAFVVAAAGVPVVKHGNRSSRGLCGSSDLLEALGLPVVESLAYARATYRETRLAFLHAPLYHPATRAVVAARRVLGIPTIFNKLGPLTNPARIAYQIAGVADPTTARCAAQVMRNLGRRGAIAMTSSEGCDEFSPHLDTVEFIWDGQRLRRRTLHARDLLSPDDRRGGWGALPPDAAAEEARRILAGGGGARRGAVLITAGASLWISGKAPDLKSGIEAAREALDSGHAETLLLKLVTLGRRYRRGRG